MISMTLKERTNNFADRLTAEINNRLVFKQYNKAKEIIDMAVNEFYGAYGPIYYDRNGELGSFAYPQVIGGGQEFSFQLGAEFGDDYHRIGNQYIYNVVFRQGYHGGAKHNGGYYWRTPIPYFTYWGRRAVKTTSPRDLIVMYWNAYITGEYEQDKQTIMQQVIQKYIAEFQEIMKEITEYNAQLGKVTTQYN